MALNLERHGPTPIYQQIQVWMRQQIASGAWPEHYQLRAESTLVEELQVSRGTVRRAIDDLIEEGLLIRVHGRGTFVAAHTLEQSLLSGLVTFSEDLITRGIPFATEVLEKTVMVPDAPVAGLLDVADGERVFFLRRLRLVEEEPVVVLHNYVLHKRCPGLEEADFRHQRLFEVLEEQCGLALEWGRRTFTAEAAPDQVASLLNLAPGAPVMALQQIVYLQDGSPIELSNLWIRGDRFRLTAEVRRDAFNRTEQLINHS